MGNVYNEAGSYTKEFHVCLEMKLLEIRVI